MAIRKIAQIGHPVLRQVAREVSREELASPAIQQFIDGQCDAAQQYTRHIPVRVSSVMVRTPLLKEPAGTRLSLGSMFWTGAPGASRRANPSAKCFIGRAILRPRGAAGKAIFTYDQSLHLPGSDPG